MVNPRINKEIQKAKLAYGKSLIEESCKDFYNWTSNRSSEYNIDKGKGFSRKTEIFTCAFCGKRFCQLDSFRTPVYLRYRGHTRRCERKDWEEELNNFHECEGENFLKE